MNRTRTIALIVLWVFVAAGLAWLVTGCGPSDCEICGGHTEQRNCHQETSSITVWIDYGNGMVMPMTNTTETTVCDHVCVGARPYHDILVDDGHGGSATIRTCK